MPIDTTSRTMFAQSWPRKIIVVINARTQMTTATGISFFNMPGL